MKTKLNQSQKMTLLGLACAWAAGLSINANAQHVPNGTNEIGFADFDLAVPSFDYGYFYSDGNIGGENTRDRFFYEPPDLTNAVFRYTFDATVFAGFTSWWGTGFGLPVPWGGDPLVFNSLETADYILSFDARVEGLATDQTTADCMMEFRLGVGSTPTWALVKALPYNPGSNWTHFVFNLDQGTYIAADGQPVTSYTTFTNGIATGITDVRFNQNQDKPTKFGPDADNAIYMDNIKLEVLQYAGPPPPPPPKQAVVVFDYNFDDKALWWIWPNFPDTTTGWSANANKATFWGVNPAVGEGIGGSNALQMNMDNSLMLTDPPGAPAWAGGNMSAGGPADYTQMASKSLKDYLLTFSARAKGLLDGENGSTEIIMQFYFNAPDDTLSPADADTNFDTLLRLNVPVGGIKTNWQTLTATLNSGAVDGGSLANFETYLGQISEVSFQIQIQNPHVQAVWGTDADNQILVDNFKLERLVTATPPLQAQAIGANLVVSWAQPATGTAKLQSSTTVNGNYADVPGASSPYTNAISGAPKYFRTQWIAPVP